MKTSATFLLGVFLLAFLSACAPAPTATPVPTATALPTATATSTPTPTATATSTPKPTDLPKAPQTPTSELRQAEITVLPGADQALVEMARKYAIFGPDYRIKVDSRVTVSRVDGKGNTLIAVRVGDRLVSVGSIRETLAVNKATPYQLSGYGPPLFFETAEELDLAKRAIENHEIGVAEIKDRNGNLIGYGWFNDRGRLVAYFDPSRGRTVLNDKNGFIPGPVQVTWLASDGAIPDFPLKRINTPLLVKAPDGSFVLQDESAPAAPIIDVDHIPEWVTALAIKNGPKWTYEDLSGSLDTATLMVRGKSKPGDEVRIFQYNNPDEILTVEPNNNRMILRNKNGEEYIIIPYDRNTLFVHVDFSTSPDFVAKPISVEDLVKAPNKSYIRLFIGVSGSNKGRLILAFVTYKSKP
jgi:hypothetical protein